MEIFHVDVYVDVVGVVGLDRLELSLNDLNEKAWAEGTVSSFVVVLLKVVGVILGVSRGRWYIPER